MKDWKNYFDGLGILRNGDTGDSAREMGTYLAAQPLDELSHVFNGDVYNLGKCFIPKINAWVRHPQPTDSWHKDPKEFSRDQWTGVMLGLIHFKKLPIAMDLIKGTWRGQRLLMAQNKDVITYEYVLYLRAFWKWWMFPLYPLVCFLDLGLLINVLIRIVKSYTKPIDTADDINVFTMCMIFSQNNWTPITWLARKLYKLHKNGVLWAFQSYYKRPEAPPMDELYKPLIEKYIGVRK